MDIRKLTADEVEITLETEADDLDMARFDSGEPEHDEEDRRRIIERVEQGDQWAWFRATVTVKWGMFEGSDSLCGCNYASEEDFRGDDYFDSLVTEALARLNEKVEEAARAISFLFRAEDPLQAVNRDLFSTNLLTTLQIGLRDALQKSCNGMYAPTEMAGDGKFVEKRRVEKCPRCGAPVAEDREPG